MAFNKNINKTDEYDRAIALVITKLQDAIKYIYTLDDISDFDLSIFHQGSDGEYEVFYFTGELSYESFSKAFDYLNPIVQDIDEDAYFDMEDSGRAICLISEEKLRHLNIDQDIDLETER